MGNTRNRQVAGEIGVAASLFLEACVIINILSKRSWSCNVYIYSGPKSHASRDRIARMISSIQILRKCAQH